MVASVDLVADVGESFGTYSLGDDDAVLSLLTSANVACGFHAGDPMVMDRTVRACVERGVAVGAHPGFRDLVGFGRRPLAMTADEVAADVLYQLGSLDAFARRYGTQIQHVTPHGSLGNLAVTDPVYAEGIVAAVLAFDETLPLVTQVGVLAELARERGLPVAITGMADRAYNADGSLVPRKLPGAVIHDPDVVVGRVLRMVEEGAVVAYDGSVVQMDCHTVLIHGDSPEAVELARGVRDALVERGVLLQPMSAVLAAERTGI